MSSCSWAPVWAPTRPCLPTLDHTARSEHHRERLAAVVAVVELDAVGAPHADVVDDDGVAGLGGGPVPSSSTVTWSSVGISSGIETAGLSGLVVDGAASSTVAVGSDPAGRGRRSGIRSGGGRGFGAVAREPRSSRSSSRCRSRRPQGRATSDRGEQYGGHGPAHRRDATGRVLRSATSRAATSRARTSAAHGRRATRPRHDRGRSTVRRG